MTRDRVPSTMAAAWRRLTAALAAAARLATAARWRRLPRVRQHDVTDCGAACLVAVAAYHGRRVPIARVRQLAGTDRDGTTMLGLVAAAGALGLVAKGVRGPAASIAMLPLPALAHLTLEGGLQHYAVVYRVSGSHVLAMDPADGRLHRLTRAAFGARWTGVALLVTPAVPGSAGGPAAAALPERAGPAARLWALVRPHRTVMAHALVGALVHTVLGLAASVYVRHVVDSVLPNGDSNLLNLMSAAMVALLGAQAYVGAMKGVLALRTGQRIDAQLVAGYYAHLLRLPQRFFDTMRVGEITTRVSDAVKIRAFVNDAALDLAVSALVVVLATATVAAYSPRLALVVLAGAPLYWAVYEAANRLNRRHQRALMERGAELESHLVESLTAVGTVRRFGIEWFAELRMETRFVRLLRSVRASALTAIAAAAATELLARLAVVALFWTGARLVLAGDLTPGELMSCYALLAYLTTPLGRLVAMNRTVHDALIAADRLFEIMDLEREDERPHLDLGAALGGDLRFEQLSARYGGRPRVLHDVTFTVPRGAVTAVVGESGSGKSTLAALAQRIYPADGGRVRLGDHDVAHLSLAALRAAVGVVPQRADLFTGTLLDNIALGELEPDARRVVAACQLVGLGDLVASLPHGLHSQVGEQGGSLSGGQRQRVALARALYRRPAVLILDEATAALDSIAERLVQQAVRGAAADGCAVLVIAHRLSTVVDAHGIVVLEAGRVVEQGTHAELLRRGGAYSRLWAHQYPAAA